MQHDVIVFSYTTVIKWLDISNYILTVTLGYQMNVCSGITRISFEDGKAMDNYYCDVHAQCTISDPQLVMPLGVCQAAASLLRFSKVFALLHWFVSSAVQLILYTFCDCFHDVLHDIECLFSLYSYSLSVCYELLVKLNNSFY